MKPGLWEAVIERDAQWVFAMSGGVVSFPAWRSRQRLICVVPMLQPANTRNCQGKQTVDHVKDEPMLGKRAPDDEQHLVAMCEAHNVWYPPNRDLRRAEREYLRKMAVEAGPTGA